MTASLSPAFHLRVILGCMLSFLFLGGISFALPLGATCETQNCDPGLTCKNGNGQSVPPGAGPGSCVALCDNDNFCDTGETVQYCPSDCHCGNGTCEPASPWSENSANCAQDCYCGNGTVEVGENNCNCPADVPATTCGDGCCKAGETPSNCSSDCGPPPLCPNGVQDPGETFCNCPEDVPATTCGDGCCVAGQGENLTSCYTDCGSCGDGQCTSPETLSTCPSDCHTCGDGQCTSPWENGGNCVDCQIPSCTISGPSVCRNNTYTFDCNHYYANGPISMSSSNPSQTSSTDSISVTIGSSAQGVTSLACFNNGSQLCSTSRSIGYCGDSVTNCNEACDYGNSFPNACDPSTCNRMPCSQQSDCGSSLFVCDNGFCDIGYCGDGIVSLGEQCEQNSDCAGFGNGYVCGGCYCSPPGGGGGGGGNPVCGNYITETGEQCDDGDNAHPGQGGTIIDMDTCDGATCTKVNVCGDGIIGPGEQCDNGGKCTKYPASTYPPLGSDPYCNEESDCNYASNAVCAPRGGDGCSVACQIEPGRVCGDGTVAGTEQCDDGNTTNGDGCDNNCTTTACGNGIVTGTEECDDGNTNNGDGCSSICQGAFCGDGILQQNGADGQPGGGDDEVCDDGNAINGDGCTADCSYCGLHCPDCSVKLPNLDIFFVVDTSDSMLEGSDNNYSCADGICKLIDAKTAIEMFVNALNPAEDRVALISFNSTATVKYGLSANTGFSSMIFAVNALQATGLTNMGSAMNTLSSLAGGYSYAGRVPVVIFLGDGQPTLPNSPDPVTYTQSQANAFHAAYPDFKVYSIGLDLVSLTPTNQAIALDLLQNYIASTPADFYNGVPGGRGAVCGGGKGSDGAANIGSTEFSINSLAGGLGLAETYGQIWNQMCQCGLTPPTPVCSGGGGGGSTTKSSTTAGTTAGGIGGGGDTVHGTPKGGFCAGNSKLSCTTNTNCGLQGPCITSNNLCGGREWYSCEGGVTCEGCGDGILQPGEQCDQGDANGTVGAGCDTFCKLTTYCGDGIVQDCEVCDDGNNIPGDGCSPRCTKESIVCGDSVVNACGVLSGAYLVDSAEEGYCSEDSSIACNGKGLNCPAGKGVCLEGTYCNLGSQGICLNDSSVTCTSNFDCVDKKTGIGVCVGLALAQLDDPSVGGPVDLKEICGGGSEFCDDGNTVGGDSCPADCQATCGNGIVEGVEACDDGNIINTDSCTNNCSIAFCGDSIVRTGIEQCDDGKNGDNDDGCTDQCLFGACDPTTLYASGAVPGWSCPVDWVLQGCPGAYLCVKKTIAPIECTGCGNGTKDLNEDCDWSDPSDPFREGCNASCLLSYCGDGNIFTGVYATGVLWNRTSTGASISRPVLQFSRVITQGQGGLNYILESGAGEGSAFGKTITVINDIDADGFGEVAVGAPGHNVGGVTNHGQIFSLSFDAGGKVDLVRQYYSGTVMSGGADLWIPTYLESIGDIENSIFGAGSFPSHKEFVYSSIKQGLNDRLLALFVGKYPVYTGVNLGSVSIVGGYTSNQITDLATIGDIDNNGVEDIVAIVPGASPTDELQLDVMLLKSSLGLYLTSNKISGLGFVLPGQGKISPLGDSDGDGVEDLLVSRYSEATGQMVIKRILLNSNGTLKSQSIVQTITTNKANFSYAIYGQDIDEDGVKDIVTIRGKESPFVLDGLVLFMHANRTIKSSQLVDFGASKAQGDIHYYPHEAIFLPDFDNDGDETIAIGSPKSFNYKGAIYTYELQAPYGHELTGSNENIEECDAGSYCDDLLTRCEDNPAICPGGPSHCAPRYLNGCTPFCQLGCGDGVVDSNGVDGIPNTPDDEECDDGNGNMLDGCTNECKRPSCGDSILTLNSTWTGRSGEWPNGYYEQCDPSSSGQNNGSCLNDCTLTGSINAICNFSFASSAAYNVNTVDDLLQRVDELNDTLCYPRIGNMVQGLTGIVDPLNTGIITAWTRTCQGQLGGQSAQCTLPRWSCGDGVLDVWNVAGVALEECDDGNLIAGDGCNEECKWEDPLIAPGYQCTAGTYPQVEVGEYLPARWVGQRSDSVGDVGATCASTTENIVIRDSIMCQVDIQRGDPILGTVVVKTESVPCGTKATQGIGLISGAIADFAPGVSINQTLGTYLFTPAQVTTWVNYQGNPLYGQYQMGVKTMNMNYCALRRMNANGTVTGEITEFSNFENCENNVDDNGNGVIDCADPLCGNIALHPNCDPNRIGGGSTECLQNSDCLNAPDNFVCNGEENYCDPITNTCKVNPADEAPYFACQSIHPNLFCDDSDPLLNSCREAQRQALGIIVGCYEKLIKANRANSQNGNQQCTGLSFISGNSCYIPGCDNPGVPGTPPFYTGPEYTTFGVPVWPTGLPANYQSTFGVAFRDEGVALHAPVLQTMLSGNLQIQFPGMSGIVLHPLHLSWFNEWLANGQSEPVANPPYQGQGGGLEEDCSNGIDENNDGIVDCSAGNCSQSANCLLGWNEDCFDVDANGIPIDNNNDGVANENDPDCSQFYGEEVYQAPQPIGPRTPGAVTYTSSGAMCEAGFSVSKGYFVQQGFAFSEQANTGLDTASFTSIGGVSLVAEGTAIDESLNTIATYQGAGKKYLFDDFISTWTTKAVNVINPNGNVDTSVQFLKVPTAHIYFWNGSSDILTLNTTLRNLMLSKGGVDPSEYTTTPYTIVLPDAANQLVVEGSLLGNGMYISQGNIKFSSSAELGCDGSDVVEGLFVAGGSFDTDRIGNKVLTQDKRCKGGNLQIKGTLLGMNAGAALAPLRRSVLNAWSSGNLLFDESKVYQVKELFETCYLPALLDAKAKKIVTTPASAFVGYTSPIAGCDANTLWGANRESVKLSAKNISDALLNSLPTNIFAPAMLCTNCTANSSKINFLLPMMYQGVLGSGSFLVPGALKIYKPNGTPTTISLQPNINLEGTLLYAMQQQNKIFPSRWFQGGRYNATTKTVTIDLRNQIDKKEMIEDLSKVVGNIRQQFLSFPNLSLLANTPSTIATSPGLTLLETNTLFGKLNDIWGSAYANLFNSVSVFSKSTCTYCLAADASSCKKGSYNKFICSPDIKYLNDNREGAETENSSRQNQVIEGSSVVILSNPIIWTELPPGAKTFLNSLTVVPTR